MPISENDLTLRLVKGFPLTAQEMDDNLRKLANFANALESNFSGIFNPDGTLKDGAVSTTDVIADRIVTSSKLGWLFNFYCVADGVNNYTAQISPSVDFTYGDGITNSFVCFVKFTNANTSTACSIDFNGAGARNLTKRGGMPLEIGDIPAGFVAVVAFDGANMQITNILPSSATVVPGVGDAIQSFSTTGTFTAPAGFTKFRIKAWAGGGGGRSSVSGSTGIGGGGAEYAESIIVLNPLEVVPVTIGAAGVGGGTGGMPGGSSGGDTIFGSNVVKAIGGHYGGTPGTGGVGQLLIPGQYGELVGGTDVWANGGGSHGSSASNGSSALAGKGVFPGGGGGAKGPTAAENAYDGAGGLIVVEPLG